MKLQYRSKRFAKYIKQHNSRENRAFYAAKGWTHNFVKDSCTGTDICSLSFHGYMGTRPVTKEGKTAFYAQIALAVAAFGPMSRKELLEFIGKPTRAGYYCSVFSFLTGTDLLRYDCKTNTYQLGDTFTLWHRYNYGPLRIESNK